MNRRKALKVFSGGAGLAASMANTPGPLQAAQAAARRGMPPLKITDVKVIMTQPAGSNLVVVKVLTNEPGLYGVGCATHAERPFAVAAYLEKHLKPFVIGKNCDEIEDIWQSSYVIMYSRISAPASRATTRSAVSMARCGTFSESAVTCPSINCWVGRCALPCPCTRTRLHANCPIWKIKFASTWPKATVTCECNWQCPAFLDTAWAALRPRRKTKASGRKELPHLRSSSHTCTSPLR